MIFTSSWTTVGPSSSAKRFEITGIMTRVPLASSD
jgi:hypothetical protein